MVAPRALLVISAKRDALQFSVDEAAKSVAQARQRFRLLGVEEKIRHLAVDSGHDYNAPMREAMYGWVEKWLGGRGNGDPVKEPEIHLEPIDSLRCYPDGPTRPKTIVTIPDFASDEGAKLLAALPKAPNHKEHWKAEAERLRLGLKNDVLGGFPPRRALGTRLFAGNNSLSYRITTESGIHSTGEAIIPTGTRGRQGTVVIAIPSSKIEPASSQSVTELTRPWLASGFATLTVADARLTELDVTNVAPVAGVPDHNPAEWGLWVNRPLLGQWTWDLIRWLDFLDEEPGNVDRSGRQGWKPARPYIVIGLGPMSVPALFAAGLDLRVAGVVCERCLVSYVGLEGKPWSGHPMGLMAPNILELGDIGHFAALLAPRPFVLASAVEPDRQPSAPARIRAAFLYAARIYRLLGAEDRLALGAPGDPRMFLRAP